MEILIDNRQKRIDIDLDDLRKKTERVLEGLGCRSSVILSISLVDSHEMAEINLKYRGKEGPTNVLSFSQREGEGTESQADLLGDVVICTDVAADEAAQLGYSDGEMALYLLIHGLLHLHGYDHVEPPDAQAMQEELDLIFEELVR